MFWFYPFWVSQTVSGISTDNNFLSYCASDKFKKNEMGGACSVYGGGERDVQGFGGEVGREETTGETQAQMGR